MDARHTDEVPKTAGCPHLCRNRLIRVLTVTYIRLHAIALSLPGSGILERSKGAAGAMARGRYRLLLLPMGRTAF